jgi:hypothetical protein
MNDWRDNLNPLLIGQNISWDLSNLGGLQQLITYAFQLGMPVLTAGWNGTLDVPHDQVDALLVDELNFTPFLVMGRNKAGEIGTRYFQNSTGLVAVETAGSDETSVTVGVRLFSEDIFQRIRTFCNDHLKQHDRKGGVVFALMREGGSLQLKRLGKAEVALERDNYTDAALAGIDYVKQDLAAVDPSGRLSIFSGPPGTGKTHIIKALLGLESCTFILIQSSYAELIGGPEFLPILYRAHEDTSMPLVIVLEDGDNAVAKRDADNASAVSALLNVSDGIIGSLLDIRVVVTSNVDRVRIDPALTRAGRLSRHVEVAPLPFEKAEAIYRKLMQGPADAAPLPRKSQPYTLAEIYAQARGSGWIPPKDEKRLGFQQTELRAVVGQAPTAAWSPLRG